MAAPPGPVPAAPITPGPPGAPAPAASAAATPAHHAHHHANHHHGHHGHELPPPQAQQLLRAPPAATTRVLSMRASAAVEHFGSNYSDLVLATLHCCEGGHALPPEFTHALEVRLRVGLMLD
jgi:hypothetical protein